MKEVTGLNFQGRARGHGSSLLGVEGPVGEGVGVEGLEDFLGGGLGGEVSLDPLGVPEGTPAIEGGDDVPVVGGFFDGEVRGVRFHFHRPIIAIPKRKPSISFSVAGKLA